MKKILCTGLLTLVSGAFAQEPFSTAPKQESLQEAIRFEKYKEISAEKQAKKDAAEQERTSSNYRRSKTTAAKTNKSSPDHRTGQADSSKNR